VASKAKKRSLKLRPKPRKEKKIGMEKKPRKSSISNENKRGSNR
jgi:hypothetical protein